MAFPSSSFSRRDSPAPEEITPAPAIAPWTQVQVNNIAIPFLQQVVLDDIEVQKYAKDPIQTKRVRYLLVTHSDGGRNIEDLAGFRAKELCSENTAANNALLVQLGESLAKKLGIGRGNTASNDTWDVLAQIPTKYLAFYRNRRDKTKKSSPDLYIAGHHSDANFDSIEQFARHLAWLATADDNDTKLCGCKVCEKERRKGRKGADQLKRKKRWIDYSTPSKTSLPDWFDFPTQFASEGWNFEEIVEEHREVKRAERRARGAAEEEDTTDEEGEEESEDVEMNG